MSDVHAYYLEHQGVYAVRNTRTGKTIRYSKERPTGMPVTGGPGKPATTHLSDGTPVTVHMRSSKRRGKT